MGVGRGALVGELYDWICGSVGSLLNFCPAPKGLLATLAWAWSSTSSTPGWMFFLAVWQGVIPVALRAFVVPLAVFFLAFAPLMEGDAVASGDETPFCTTRSLSLILWGRLAPKGVPLAWKKHSIYQHAWVHLAPCDGAISYPPSVRLIVATPVPPWPCNFPDLLLVANEGLWQVVVAPYENGVILSICLVPFLHRLDYAWWSLVKHEFWPLILRGHPYSDCCVLLIEKIRELYIHLLPYLYSQCIRDPWYKRGGSNI